MKKILSIQGGGCYGIGPARFLSGLEAALPKTATLASMWDWIGGTSVGSIIGACVAIGLPAKDILAFFQQDAPVIFGSPRWWLQRLRGCYKYDAAALEAALQKHLGEHTLADCVTPFIATAIDMSTGRNVYFQSYGKSGADEDEIIIGPDSGWKLWEVCRASSAAQSYFPAFVKGGMVLWDGGFSGQNAPDLLLLDEVNDDRKAAMLSLGHGRLPWTVKGADMIRPSFKQVIAASLAMATGAPAQAAVWGAKRRLGTRHLRVDPPLARDYGIDDASGPTQAVEMAAWDKAFAATDLSLFLA
ncbi:MAG: patatin-like phospholipase family protein [Patescibacteria group bacterium]|nr:patatin-like phospholipase family protein [Patescibacteria group bacterium]